MKKLTKKILLIATILLVLFISFFLVLDLIIMPSVVEAPEVKMPNVVGIDKEEAKMILKSKLINILHPLNLLTWEYKTCL